MDIKEKISKVMKQAVDHCEVMGVNLLVEKEGEELRKIMTAIFEEKMNKHKIK